MEGEKEGADGVCKVTAVEPVGAKQELQAETKVQVGSAAVGAAAVRAAAREAVLAVTGTAKASAVAAAQA